MTTLALDGDFDAERGAAAAAEIDSVASGPLTIELGDAEVIDGAACAALVSAIRRAAKRLGDVVLIEPPQVIAHTLYRVGALGPGTIRLVEPRDEIGTTS